MKISKRTQQIFRAWDRHTPRTFSRWLLSHGWKRVRTPGSYKLAYVKGRRVLKYDNQGWYGHTLGEWKKYQRASKKEKALFARCIAYHDGLLLQEHAGKLCPKMWTCAEAERIAISLHLEDWGHNHTCVKGQVKFFDYAS